MRLDILQPFVIVKPKMTQTSALVNVAVLGGNSRVGRLLRRAIAGQAETGVKFWFFSRHPADQDHHYWQPEHPEGLQALVDQLGHIDCLLNLTGPAHTASLKVLADNTELACACLTDAKRLGIPQVFLASSAAVYGIPTTDAPLSEESCPNPVSNYGQSKLAMEQAVHCWFEKQVGPVPAVTCLRIGNVAGADKLLLSAMKATKNQPLPLDRFGDGQGPRRSYIGPETLARVLQSLCQAAQDGRNLPDILNVATPEMISMADLLTALSAAEQPVNWRYQLAGAHAIPAIWLSSARLEKLYEFSAEDQKADEMIRQFLACRGAT